jgi:hypothetical protein
MTDPSFDPDSGSCYDIEETKCSLANPADVERLIFVVAKVRIEVGVARVKLKTFIAKTYKIEDILRFVAPVPCPSQKSYSAKRSTSSILIPIFTQNAKADALQACS